MKKIIITLLLFIRLSNLLFSESAELKITNGILYGNIELPLKDGVSPIVIIVAGSGPTDRNGNSQTIGVIPNSYKMLAEDLARNNIASLRYDKRGIAASVTGQKEENLRFDDYVNDLILWIKQIKLDKRFNKIYIAGHSEGSLIAILALQKENCDGFISISGAGRKISDILIEQLTKNQNNPKELIEKSKEIINKLLNGKTEDNIPAVLLSLFRPSVQPYLISWFKYDPSEEIKKLSLPILILQGTEDIQISIIDAEILFNSNKKAILQKIDGVTHTMKEINNPSEQMSSYSDPNIPLSKELVKSIVNFIK